MKNKNLIFFKFNSREYYYEGWGLSHGNYFFWQDQWIMKKYGNIQIEVDALGCLNN